jgi:hypothetical protein
MGARAWGRRPRPGADTQARGPADGVAVLANGDELFVRFKGITMFKDTLPQTGQGKWKFTGGTGKLKGIKGDGIYTGQFNPDGTSSFEIKGNYQLSSK